MPFYDYECPICKQKFEAQQKITDGHLKACLKCGASNPKRLISSNVNLIFKGVGFYVNDYGKVKKGKHESDRKNDR